jgi:hypothetical protein
MGMDFQAFRVEQAREPEPAQECKENSTVYTRLMQLEAFIYAVLG